MATSSLLKSWQQAIVDAIAREILSACKLSSKKTIHLQQNQEHETLKS
jgi:hypothetical protein